MKRIVLMAALMLVAAGASAAKLTLYGRAGFRGRESYNGSPRWAR